MCADMARLGWDTAQLAREASKSYKTIDYFLRVERQTSKTAGAIAKALKQDTSRYLIGIEAVA